MKDNKLPGVDGIPPKLLKEIVEQVCTAFAKAFNFTRRRNSSFSVERSKNYVAS